jgi:hypothetical protein
MATWINNPHYADIYINIFEKEPVLLKKTIQPATTENNLYKNCKKTMF